MSGRVLSVHRDGDHRFSKPRVDQIELVAGLGVAGDAHFGAQVQHRSRVAADASQPNLRQVHLMHSELFEVASAKGFTVGPGDLGENITTSDIDLLTLPVGTTLAIGAEAIITLTGLRNPCKQIDAFQQGLLGSVALERGADGELKRLAGVMAVVVSGGTIAPGDRIEVGLPPTPHRPLDRV